MFSILIYISLPFVFLFHDIEEIAKRQRWARINVDRIGGMYPNMRPMLVHLRDMSNRSFCIIVAEELLLISLAVICAIYGTFMAPLFALTWGFCIHLVVHIVQALAVKGYIPGLTTSVLLLPYVGIAVADMLQQFSWQQNLLYAVSGIIIVILNLILMHMIFNK
jgi:hypothetical protein